MTLGVITLPTRERWGVIMRKDCPLAKKKNVRASDLVKWPLILSRQAMSNELSTWFGEKMDSLRVAATYNLYFNASVMVEEGVGLMLAWDNLANTGKESNLTFRPLSPKLESGLCFAWKKFQVFSRAEKLFLDALKSRFSVNEDI